MEEAATIDPMAGGLVTPAGRRPRIAVVDANPTTRMIAATLVDQFGGAVSPFASLAEAAASLGAGGADLVLVRSGREPGASLGPAAASVPVVAIGGDAGPAAAARVPMPYAPHELYEALARTLAAGRRHAIAGNTGA